MQTFLLAEKLHERRARTFRQIDREIAKNVTVSRSPAGARSRWQARSIDYRVRADLTSGQKVSRKPCLWFTRSYLSFSSGLNAANCSFPPFHPGFPLTPFFSKRITRRFTFLRIVHCNFGKPTREASAPKIAQNSFLF